MVFNSLAVTNRKLVSRVPSSRWDVKLCVTGTGVTGLCAKTVIFKTNKDTVLKLVCFSVGQCKCLCVSVWDSVMDLLCHVFCAIAMGGARPVLFTCVRIEV